MLPAGSAFGRAALAGNPSDGYGGAVLAVPLQDFRADVEVEPAGSFAAEPADADAEALLAAAARRFALQTGRDRPVVARWRTTVPREVGLAGSSALITAMLRALCELHGVDLAPDELALVALEAETVELGVAAGLQDRVVQAYGMPVFMDFAASRYEPLDAALVPALVVAWLPGAAAPSGLVHGELRARYEAGDPAVREPLEALAGHAHAARAALLGGDAGALARAMDASLALRRQLMAVHPAHLELADTVRAHCPGVNSTGSGGAVVAPAPDHLEPLRAACAALGAEVARVRIPAAQTPYSRRVAR